MRNSDRAEFIAVSSSKIITKRPTNVSHNQAATLLVGPMTALQLLRNINIDKHDKVMIYGASGSVGSFAIQIAKNHGATVTGVCSSSNFEMVKSLGADLVVDYRSQEFIEHNEKYDLVFDAVGKLSRKDKKRFLGEGGDSGSTWGTTKESVASLNEIRDLVEANKLKTFIDRTYSLDESIEAYKYVKSWRKKGNVVIQII